MELGDAARILGNLRMKKVPVVKGQMLAGIVKSGDLIPGIASWIKENMNDNKG